VQCYEVLQNVTVMEVSGGQGVASSNLAVPTN